MIRKTSLTLIVCVMMSVLMQIEAHHKAEKHQTEFHFRNLEWGITMDAVKQLETTNPIDESEDILVYDSEMLGMPIVIIYQFIDNRLFRYGYLTTQNHSNPNNYLYDYQTVKDALIKQYGKPVVGKGFTDIIWRDNCYTNKPDRHGYAAGIGHLIRCTEWEINERNTSIVLTVCGQNHQLDICIIYSNTQLDRVWQSQHRGGISQ